MSPVVALLAILSVPTASAEQTALGEACDLAAVGASGTGEFLRFDQELRAALSSPDPAALALLTRFPLRINAADGSKISLDNPTALQAHLAEAFPQPVRAAVLKQKPQNLFCNGEGIMYGNGEVWVELVGQGKARHYRVAAVNVPALGAQALPPGTPKLEYVCTAEKHRAVIDSGPTGTVRYRAWNKPRFLPDRPDLEVAAGTVGVTGTGPCARTVWKFAKDDAEFAVSTLGCTSGSEPQGATGWLEVWVHGKRHDRWWCY